MTTTLSSSNSGDSVVGSLRERVDRGAAEPAVADRVGERVLVDDAAATRVDEPHPGLGVREHFGVHEADRVGRLRRVDRHEVGDRDELGHRLGELHAELAGPIGAHERVVGDEPHPERVRTLRDEHTDPTEADDAERLAVQLDAFPLRAIPPPGLQIGVGLRHVARLREQQRHRVLGRREDVRLGAFTTITPRWVASATSTLSRPMPARPTTTRSVPAASTSAVTWVALRITSAATPGSAAQSSSGVSPVLTSTSRPARASRRARVPRVVRRRERGVP